MTLFGAAGKPGQRTNAAEQPSFQALPYDARWLAAGRSPTPFRGGPPPEKGALDPKFGAHALTRKRGQATVRRDNRVVPGSEPALVCGTDDPWCGAPSGGACYDAMHRPARWHKRCWVLVCQTCRVVGTFSRLKTWSKRPEASKRSLRSAACTGGPSSDGSPELTDRASSSVFVLAPSRATSGFSSRSAVSEAEGTSRRRSSPAPTWRRKEGCADPDERARDVTSLRDPARRRGGHARG
jgi:hypothetical protein